MKASAKTWSTPVAAEERRMIPCALCGGDRFRPSLRCEGFHFVRCAGCGLVQANPQPTKAAIRLRYREGHGKDYLAYELENEASFLNLQLLALADAGFPSLETELRGRLDRPPRILDVGCATGALLEHLQRRGWDCTGVELSAPQAEYARRRGLRIFDTPLEQVGLPDGGFDLVTASHLIEHLNEPADFVREVRRILSPGGRFIATTPNIDGLQARLFRGAWRSAIFDHLYLFSRNTLGALLLRTGFIVEKTVTWGGLGSGTAPRPLKSIADRLAKPLGFGDVMMMRARKA